jgi:hypothetical protein
LTKTASKTINIRAIRKTETKSALQLIYIMRFQTLTSLFILLSTAFAAGEKCIYRVSRRPGTKGFHGRHTYWIAAGHEGNKFAILKHNREDATPFILTPNSTLVEAKDSKKTRCLTPDGDDRGYLGWVKFNLCEDREHWQKTFFHASPSIGLPVNASCTGKLMFVDSETDPDFNGWIGKYFTTIPPPSCNNNNNYYYYYYCNYVPKNLIILANSMSFFSFSFFEKYSMQQQKMVERLERKRKADVDTHENKIPSAPQPGSKMETWLLCR